jgi:glutamyl-tRNA synthetase
MSVKVRFAPSPTGSPHVGNLRTAIYDWLLAKREGGVFLVRLEDTDRSPERYAPESVADLEESLRYLRILPDYDWVNGGPDAPYIQSERLDKYHAVVNELLEAGQAYRCYCTKERLEKMRQEQQERGVPSGYDRRCRNLPAADRERYEAEGLPSVVRLKMPMEGLCILHDPVRGELSYEYRLQDDQVLLKSDGFPTYFLAATVDDHLMGITHVLRGEEWLGSAPKMMHLYAALGWKPPIIAHLPVILGNDRKKLSKRHGATNFRWFIEQGYLPEALLNFLVLLGWSTGEENREILSVAEIIERFSLDGITEHPAIFDYEKLKWMNGRYIRHSPPGRIIGLCLPYLVKAGLISDPPTPEEIAYARRIIPLEQERMKTLSEVVELVGFFFEELDYPKGYDEKGIAKWLGLPHIKPLLEREIAAFSALPEWTPQALEAAARAIGEELGVKFAEVVHPTRLAATGRTVGPGLYETLWALGRERVLQRLQTVSQRV